MLIDTLNREINYLRISVTDRCMLNCIYCMADAGIEQKEILSITEILRSAEILVQLGIKKIRITGGEPLLREDIVELVTAIKQIEGIEGVYLTTNGILLKNYIDKVKSSKTALLPHGINISIDALSNKNYELIKDVKNVKPLEISTIIDMLLKENVSVKINCVALRGINEEELIPIASIAKDRDVYVRFIELMPLGPAVNYTYIKGEEITSLLCEKFGALTPCTDPANRISGPALYYNVPGFTGKVGFINPLSHKFCNKCNRLRLNSRGFLLKCLSSNEELDLNFMLKYNMKKEDIFSAIKNFVFSKAAHHTFLNEKHSIGMYKIGG